MRFIPILFILFLAVPTFAQLATNSKVVRVQVQDWFGLEREIPVIHKAALRNNCTGKDFIILLAIRKAENGRPGLEFGVMHPRAKYTNLDTQAGWAAATIVKNRARWEKAGKPNSFIDFLGNKYCPASVDPVGNKNWKNNVKFWIKKFCTRDV